MTKKPNIKKQPSPFKPGQEHPEKKTPELGGFSDRVRRQQEQVERDRFGRRKREE